MTNLHKKTSIFFLINVLCGLMNIASNALIARSYTLEVFSLWGLFFAFHDTLKIFSRPGGNLLAHKSSIQGHHGELLRYLRGESSRFLLTLMGIGVVGWACWHFSLFAAFDTNTFFVFLAVLGTLIISFLDRSEQIMLGLNRFYLLNAYKAFNSLCLLALGILSWKLNIIPLILLFALSRLLLFMFGTISLLSFWKKEWRNQYGKEESGHGGAINKVQQLQIVGAMLPRVFLYFVERADLSLFFVASNLPSKTKDYANLAVSVPFNSFLKSKNTLSLRRFFKAMILLTYTGGGALALLAPWFIPMIFGQQYVAAVDMTRWLALAMPPRLLMGMLDKCEMNLGKFNYYYRFAYMRNAIVLVVSAFALYFGGAIWLAITFCTLFNIFFIVYLLTSCLFKEGQETV